MHLYQGSTHQFVADARRASLANQLSGRSDESRARAGEGATARLVAGSCWPWSDPDAAGQLEPDVRVGDWSMPWNARDGVGRLGPGIPKSDFWASAKEGIDQVGCVYTARGFEFDYVGVIYSLPENAS